MKINLTRGKQRWIAIAFAVFLGLPVMGFLVVSAVMLVVMFWPRQYDSVDLSQFAGDREQLAVLAHGVRDDTRSWIDPLRSIYKRQGFQGDVVAVNWNEYARSSLRCAIEGKRIGQLVGERILARKNLRSVHLIGHSCGAFVVYGACTAIKEQRPELVVQVTYLDPVSIYGPMRNYGLRRFGYCADYSEAFIDTEDDVHGSNELIPNTHTYDVTALRDTASNVSPHNWPTVYYQQLVERNLAPDFWRDDSLLKRKPLDRLETVERR